jgi:type 1 fimbriae regulatory protein FimB/type 1 fimbriae regulatory protein FimE
MSNDIALAARRGGSPAVVLGKVKKPKPPRRRKNADSRSREHLKPPEIEKLLQAAAAGRYPQRDRTLIDTLYRHGLRVSEAVALRWDAVDLQAGELHVTRLKGGKPATHPLRGPELRALRALRRDWPDSPYVFCSERGGPMTDSNVRKLVAKIGQDAKIPFPVHPHMLRHACGYYLANEGVDTRTIQDYLGHKNIAHTVRYTELAPGRFKGLFKD